jgi:hypothetical protein
MSALGQKQTCAVQNVMSALPSKADIRTAAARVDLEYFVTPPSSLATQEAPNRRATQHINYQQTPFFDRFSIKGY